MSQQAPREARTDWNTVMQDDLRPAGDGKHCFYCHEPLGQAHEQSCVIRKHAGQYSVAIRLNATGETRMYRYDFEWDGENDQWMWTEGNYGCDCNRHMLFKRAHGIEPDEADWERGCSEDQYSILYAELPDGTRHALDGRDEHEP
jgi:hypothetical protein